MDELLDGGATTGPSLIQLAPSRIMNHVTNSTRTACCDIQRRKSHIDFRHALSKASALIEQILRAG